MAASGLRDQNMLDKVSNFFIWKAKILLVLDDHRIKDHVLPTVVVPVDVDALKKYEEARALTKRMIMDRVKDHVIPHIA